MRCTNKKCYKRLLCMVCVAAVLLTGCSWGKTKVSNPYHTYTYSAGYKDSVNISCADFFAKDLCVTNNVNYGTDEVSSYVAEGAGLFNLDTKEVLYSQNLFGKMYPASTTKILTAYIIIRYGNLDDVVTVSENVKDIDYDSSVCGIQPGDEISVRDLLYGLMLCSGNDAAIALAEYYSGSIEAFAEVMNEEALKMGATNSHFLNPHGLPDEDHYTTVYDMYLLMQNAVSLDEFVKIISTKNIDVTYTKASGESFTTNWHNTNRYITGATETPEGIEVIGGKTGTTGEAGYCLVLYSTNENNDRLISIVFKADCRFNLYYLMSQILSGFAN